MKVLVLRQRRPLKILADETFLLPYRKKIATAPYFRRKKKNNSNLSPNLSFQACVPVMQTSFDKCLND